MQIFQMERPGGRRRRKRRREKRGVKPIEKLIVMLRPRLKKSLNHQEAENIGKVNLRVLLLGVLYGHW